MTLKICFAWVIVITWTVSLFASLLTDSVTVLNVTTPLLQVAAGTLLHKAANHESAS